MLNPPQSRRIPATQGLADRNSNAMITLPRMTSRHAMGVSGSTLKIAPERKSDRETSTFKPDKGLNAI